MKQHSKKQHFIIEGQKICFQPYRRKYVEEYHSWFITYPQLLYLTGSELLSLEEQYTNHQSWIEDPSKYTFIIFTKEGKMIGDINLFFSQWIEPNQAQINVMIAVQQQRGKGYARQALRLIEAFAFLFYKKTEIIAKIKEDNPGSIKLFTSSGYEFQQYEERYKQNEYRKTLKDEVEMRAILEGRVKQVANIQQIVGM